MSNVFSLEQVAEVITPVEEYRRQKMTSVLTVVFTDIANSTSLREELGEMAYEELREEHDEGVRVIVERDNAGSFLKSTGDGALIVFAEPSTAVLRCLEIQALMASHRHFRLRVGLDMGQVSLASRGGIVLDVFGRQVNRAARIQGLAKPAHVLSSFHVYDCAVGWIREPHISWHNHGAHTIKGFAGSISVHEPFDTTLTRPQDLIGSDSEQQLHAAVCSPAPQRGSSVSLMWSGPFDNSQRNLVAGEVIRIGRADGNDCVIVDHLMSRHHAIAVFDPENGLKVSSLSAAKNPIWWNGEAVREALVTIGNSFQIGQTKFLFSTGSFDPVALDRASGVIRHQLVPLNIAPSSDPISYYQDALSESVRLFSAPTRVAPSLLWLDPSEMMQSQEVQILLRAGFRVDCAHTFEEESHCLLENRYDVLISVRRRQELNTEGMRMIQQVVSTPIDSPCIAYYSNCNVQLGHIDSAPVSVFDTSGLLSLLDAIRQIISIGTRSD